MTDNGGRAPLGQALVASDGAATHLHPTGFDPSRKTFGFIKNDMDDAPGKIGVAIVQKCDGEYDGELIDFRLCDSREEMIAYLALYGLNSEPVWTAAIAMETQRAETENTGSVAKP